MMGIILVTNIFLLLCRTEGECGADNRMIQDDGTSQELTEGDIKTLKGAGMSGQVHFLSVGVALPVCDWKHPV